MLSAIISYLGRRIFLLKLGTTLSAGFVQENSVPLEEALNVALFIVKINSISSARPSMIQCSLYGDDLQI